MPKETEGAPEPPDNTPDGQAEAPDQSQEPSQPEHPPAPDADDAESQALGQAEEPEPSEHQENTSGEEPEKLGDSAGQYTDDPDYLDTSHEEDWHQDDPYHHDYEHEDHHDDHHHYDHGEYQGDEYQAAHAVNAPVPVPRSGGQSSGVGMMTTGTPTSTTTVPSTAGRSNPSSSTWRICAGYLSDAWPRLAWRWSPAWPGPR